MSHKYNAWVLQFIEYQRNMNASFLTTSSHIKRHWINSRKKISLWILHLRNKVYKILFIKKHVLKLVKTIMFSLIQSSCLDYFGLILCLNLIHHTLAFPHLDLQYLHFLMVLGTFSNHYLIVSLSLTSLRRY